MGHYLLFSLQRNTAHSASVSNITCCTQWLLYPKPCMDECIDLLGNTMNFSKPDANSGYCQVQFAQDNWDKRRLRFITVLSALQNRLLNWNAPSDVSTSDAGLADEVKCQFTLIHLDNIVVFSQITDKHIYHAVQVLTWLIDAGVTWDVKGCETSTNCYHYLCQVICSGRLEISTFTIDEICQLQNRATVTEKRSTWVDVAFSATSSQSWPVLLLQWTRKYLKVSCRPLTD